MEVEISSNAKFFKLSPMGREAISWGNIGTFRSLRLQSTAEIFLARELMGGVHNALVMWARDLICFCIVSTLQLVI
jgi:hypothetical protein